MYRISPVLIPIALTIGLAQQTAVWDAPPEAKKLKNKVSLTGEKIDGVARIYREKCVSCHGVMGNVTAATALPVQPADLTDAKVMHKMKDGEVFWKISNGRGPMPAFESQMPENDRWQMVNYVRYLTKISEYRYLGRRTPGR
jgi:mono/diheme cytochrome c family protein